ncbi:MAG TPA: DUF4252 domain-containing protein [Chryseosolibacter sp.]|nr:DUF4252 domain-containing protein [Chryseosolibacter sp.]
MNTKIVVITLCGMLISPVLRAQSPTTEALSKKHTEALGLFFYNNTLRMLNQQEDKEFDELIRDIEKMRFLMIKKNESKFGNTEYKKLVADYKAEAFEEVMTSRHEGKNFDVYLKERDGRTKGMLVLVNDADNLYVLDILGRIALDKVTKLYSTLDESTDIGSKIKAFTGGDDNDDNKEDEDDKKSSEKH